MDAESERLLREASAVQPLTIERLKELDDLHLKLLDAPRKFERNTKRVKFIITSIVTVIFGYLYDKIGLALGVPESWIGQNVFLVIWQRLF